MMRIVTLAACLMIAVSACATSPSVPSGPYGQAAQSRFDDFTETAGATDFTQYNAVFLAPITVSDEIAERYDIRRPALSGSPRPLSPALVEAKIAELREDLEAALVQVTSLADAPGADILTLEVELIALDANRPTQADFAVSPGLSLQSLYSGEAGAIVTFSTDDTVLAVARDIDRPGLDLTEPGAGIWSTADRFFRRLADKTAALLYSPAPAGA
ncbi:hypothetical protein PB2503_02247 [Parvularcula bermudensis HTCC2503]|uniref:DUF3313 domain-containing protein n=1 Tax=Parvularcula bermudensis (strain ATCC BAA-594 / HTCC2503 / KCTC 12087) TaxID=314260 RepID=E0TC94_PARBH|nr:DUF3313 family protein [Parvularcula bermudensis]ADM08527.1 hypothetical protein PB2503_02247 [Parvularcula bermudensis HTCC2503]